MNKKYTISTDQSKEAAISFIRSLPLDPVHVVAVSEYKETRSSAQNSLLWLWYTTIANDLGETKEAVHERSKKRFLVPIYERDNPEYAQMIEAVRKVYRLGMKEEAEHMHREIVKLTSTTTATVEQFTEMLNDIEKDCISIGIYLPRPEDRYHKAMGLNK